MEPGKTSEIIAAGYSQRYAAAIVDLLHIEGGYVNDPADRGGATKYGISLRFLSSEGAFDADGDGKADFDLDHDGDIDGADIRALTKADALAIYHRCFWLKLKAEMLPRPLGEMVFDQGVNGGRSAAVKLLQRTVNTCLMQMKEPSMLNVDGVLGPATMSAVDRVIRFPALGMPALVATFRDAVRERYRAIARRYPSQQRFLRGWLARAERLGR